MTNNSWEESVRKPLNTPPTTALVNIAYENLSNDCAVALESIRDQEWCSDRLNDFVQANKDKILACYAAGVQTALFGASFKELASGKKLIMPGTLAELEHGLKDSKPIVMSELLKIPEIDVDDVELLTSQYAAMIDYSIDQMRELLAKGESLVPGVNSAGF